MKELAYASSELNVKIYGESNFNFNNLFKSQKHFFNKKYLKDGYTFLDIGGAGGLIANTIKEDVADIKATIIDPDSKSIKFGKKEFPDFEFICGYFPNDMEDNRKFDAVSMQALFPQIPNWKNMLLSMRKHAKNILIYLPVQVTISGVFQTQNK